MTSSRTRKLGLPAIAAMLMLSGAAAAAPISLGEATAIFQGVTLQSATVGESQAYAVRVDLDAPGVGFTTTPPGGPLETIAQTTSQFLESSGTQVAVNANFFGPCCAALNEPKNLLGIAVSDGTVVSPFTPGEFPSSLLVSPDNEVTIASLTSAPANVDDAVSGSHILVDDGVVVAPPGETGFEGPNPRTAAGVTEDGRFLFLVTVDGRQPGYSVGTTLVETADLLLALGAFDAVNLDGGGSTTMVREGATGEPILVNRPSGGTERYNGNNFGVFALPLEVAEPGVVALLALGVFGVVAARRRTAA